MVRHTMYFEVDGETIDYTISYMKETGDNFPRELVLNRNTFSLKRTSFVAKENEVIHYRAFYEEKHYIGVPSE